MLENGGRSTSCDQSCRLMWSVRNAWDVSGRLCVALGTIIMAATGVVSFVCGAFFAVSRCNNAQFPVTSFKYPNAGHSLF